MTTERLRELRADYQRKADAEHAAGNDKMETFFRGAHSAICVVLGEMWSEQTHRVEADDSETVCLDSFARDVTNASDSEVLTKGGEP